MPVKNTENKILMGVYNSLDYKGTFSPDDIPYQDITHLLFDNVIQTIDEYNVGGVELNWRSMMEVESSEDGRQSFINAANVLSFIDEFGRVIKGKFQSQKTFMVTVPDFRLFPSRGYSEPLQSYFKAVDLVHVVSYGWNPERYSYVSFEAFKEYINAWRNLDIPSNKLVMGLAFHGVRTPRIGNYQSLHSEDSRLYDGDDGFDESIFSYHLIREMQTKPGPSHTNSIEPYDQTSQSYDHIDTVNQVPISYDDPKSLQVKALYACHEQKLAGVSVAYLHQDNGELLGALNTAFRFIINSWPLGSSHRRVDRHANIESMESDSSEGSIVLN
ncbi:hypothetical protein IWQ62_000440 [Dispira parvispora]|uniref:GH18 domain-containing protein n=1 Tax=Dispira parvispora TaxID=1520584 RepID=A0A9W8E982_9FUNG|nr:hypothetical protein IWQ62_000440 [Dispira parvispora]